MKTTDHRTTFEFVAKINGQTKYVDHLNDLDDDALIAMVRVIKHAKTGKELSRDQFVKDSDWMTVKDYYEK